MESPHPFFLPFFRKDWALKRRKPPSDNSKDNLWAVKEMGLSQKRPSKKVMNIKCSCLIGSLSIIVTPFYHIRWFFSGPTEDYSKKAVKAIVKEEDNAKMKALKASAKGTKSIASLFSKKT